MKNLSYAVVVALSFIAINSFADTDLVTSQKVTTIKGKSVSEAQYDVFAYFVPRISLIAGNKDQKQVTACNFPEDQYRASGSGISRQFKTSKSADGSYNLQLPVGGMRGACEYVLDNFSFDVKDQKMDVLITMRTKLSIDYMNAMLAISNSGPYDVYTLEPSGSVDCDFSTAATNVGAWCYLGDEMMVNDVMIQGTGETFTFDLLTKTQDPDDSM